MIASFVILKLRRGEDRLGLSLLRQLAAFDRKQMGCLGAYVGESMESEDEYILLSQWQDKKAMDFAHQAMQRNPEMSKSFAQLAQIALGKPNLGRFEML